MKWYNFIAALFAGAFLVNFIPHFVNGISGNFFPTPFANPPGKGLSSPLINIGWAFFNALIAYLLFRSSYIKEGDRWSIILFLVGVVTMSVRLSIVFAGKHSG